jgi:conjugative relaxase-like TrwC/TraI family protein
VLTVSKITANAAGYAEYLQGKAQPAGLGDYYLRDGERVEAPGRWVSGALVLLADAAQPVGGDELRSLLAVRHPDTGSPFRRAGGNGEAVAAIDATFSAPKSVSAAWAIADQGLREQIEQTHELAVDRAIAYSVGQVAMVRQRAGEHVFHVHAAGVIATSWRHSTARAVEGRAPDPQLHSHVLLHGALRREGRIAAIDSRMWFVHRREIAAAYRTELARELSKLGFQIQRATGRGGRYFELEGVPRALLDRWSGRHHQVQEAITARLETKQAALLALGTSEAPESRDAAQRLNALRRASRLTAAEDRYASWSTRVAKGQATHRDLDRQWAQTASAVGFERRQIDRLHSGAPELHPVDPKVVLEALTEFDATLERREAQAIVLERSAGVPIHESLDTLDQLVCDGELLVLDDGRYTTRQHRARELATVTLANRLAAARAPALPTELVALQARILEGELRRVGGTLSGEQRAALELACSDRRLVVIEGQAGTGKSTTLTAIARAHQSQGRQLIVTSTAALAAQTLAGEFAGAAVNATPYSTDALHHAIERGRVELCENVTVIHEEAALACTREQHRLLTAVELCGARLIEVGDPRQSQAVGAGGLWSRLQTAALKQRAHVELTRNVRAQDPADREAQAWFRAGQHDQAIRSYANRGLVTLTFDQRDAEDRALEAAHADRGAGKHTLVIAQSSNEHLDELNARAQAIRLQDGELGQHGLPVFGRPYSLHPGDRVQIRNSIKHSELGYLPNGSTATIVDIDPRMGAATIKLADGRHTTLNQRQIDQANVRLAYVQHPFPAQGQTTDSTHLIIAQNTTREGAYVALTRARQRTQIHASLQHLELDNHQDRLAALAERVSRDGPQVPSIDTPLAHEQQIVDQHTLSIDNPERPAEPDHQPEPQPIRAAHGEQRQRETAPEPTNPAAWLTVLGPQPNPADAERATWNRAAIAIERDRNAYNIDPAEPAALGPPPPPGQFQQRHEQRKAAEAVIDAIELLHPTDSNAHATLQERIINTPGLIPANHEQDRSPGWEP